MEATASRSAVLRGAAVRDAVLRAPLVLRVAGLLVAASPACAPAPARQSPHTSAAAEHRTTDQHSSTQHSTQNGLAAEDTPPPVDLSQAAPAEIPRSPGVQPAPKREACGPFTCMRFPTASAALLHVLDTDAPRALGIGESHAQANTQHVASATSRFARELLPAIADRSSALVVELLAPPSDCEQETTRQAREEVREITEGQAATNQNQFVALGHRAKALGITPYILRATCEDLDAVAAAGASGVLVIMETIARLTALEVERLLRTPAATPSQPDPSQPDPSQRIVLAYGGALHNDIEPREGRESWSYGPQLQALTNDRYTAIDLIVPEHIQDTDGWRSQPWYTSVPQLSADSSVLLRVAPRSWVVFLPAGVSSGSSSSPPARAPSGGPAGGSGAPPAP